MNVGVVGNPAYGQLPAILHQLARDARRRAISLFSEPALEAVWEQPLPPLDGAELDALLTFGGDGTLLRGARLLAGRDAPILGVNLGRVGFLTTASRANLDEAIDALVDGRYVTERRLALAATIVAPDGTRLGRHHALNDVAIHKAGVARVIRLQLTIDGEELGPYSADGLVIATPTGSTAYSLSAGGPIVLPGVEAMVVTPICAHTLAVRPVVVPATTTIAISPAASWAEEVFVSFDGQIGMALSAGTRVEVCRAERPVSLVRLGNEGFVSRMRQKLQWGDLMDRVAATEAAGDAP